MNSPETKGLVVGQSALNEFVPLLLQSSFRLVMGMKNNKKWTGLASVLFYAQKKIRQMVVVPLQICLKFVIKSLKKSLKSGKMNQIEFLVKTITVG